MEYTIYFADKAVIFTDMPPVTPHFAIHPIQAQKIDRAKILKILETHNLAAVVSADPAAAFAVFADEFKAVTAAGGVVVDAAGRWLMIHRNGRWDLPKGHLEPHETLEQCAAREVSEETGVRNVRVVRPLCDTLHAYQLRGRWELKRTYWYELHADNQTPLTPQREEGIDCAVWCSCEQLQEYLHQSFPTIRRVAECMRHPVG